MPTLREQLADAEARAEQLRRDIARADCSTAGHDLRFIGCAACCCDEEGGTGGHSIPVHECAHCRACDYGENDDADEVRRTQCDASKGASE